MCALFGASCRPTARSGPRLASVREPLDEPRRRPAAVRQWRGGSGRTFDWTLVEKPSRAAARDRRRRDRRRTMPRAARRLGAYAIDVGSAVDDAAGQQVAGEDRRSVRRASPGSRERLPRMRLTGRFGRFGGCLRPRDPRAGARAARSRVPRRAGRPGVRGRAQRAARQLCRPADAADPLPQPARQHLSQARGPAPRRRAQDQPGARPGAARQAHGQDPADRRDRRGPARRRDRHRRRAARLRDRDLHGRGGRRAAAAQRLPDAS